MDDKTWDGLPAEERERRLMETRLEYRKHEKARLVELKKSMTKVINEVQDSGAMWTGEFCVIFVCRDEEGNYRLHALNSTSERDIIATEKAMTAYRQSLEGEPGHVGMYL